MENTLTFQDIVNLFDFQDVMDSASKTKSYIKINKARLQCCKTLFKEIIFAMRYVNNSNVYVYNNVTIIFNYTNNHINYHTRKMVLDIYSVFIWIPTDYVKRPTETYLIELIEQTDEDSNDLIVNKLNIYRNGNEVCSIDDYIYIINLLLQDSTIRDNTLSIYGYMKLKGRKSIKEIIKKDNNKKIKAYCPKCNTINYIVPLLIDNKFHYECMICGYEVDM